MEWTNSDLNCSSRENRSCACLGNRVELTLLTRRRESWCQECWHRRSGPTPYLSYADMNKRKMYYSPQISIPVTCESTVPEVSYVSISVAAALRKTFSVCHLSNSLRLTPLVMVQVSRTNVISWWEPVTLPICQVMWERKRCPNLPLLNLHCPQHSAEQVQHLNWAP